MQMQYIVYRYKTKIYAICIHKILSFCGYMRKKEEKSEIWSLFEFHYVTRQRMGERKIFGMKIKAVTMETIKVITYNRHS